jgi:hypothetical protein
MEGKKVTEWRNKKGVVPYFETNQVITASTIVTTIVTSQNPASRLNFTEPE